jgi:hypothetical protein
MISICKFKLFRRRLLRQLVCLYMHNLTAAKLSNRYATRPLHFTRRETRTSASPAWVPLGRVLQRGLRVRRRELIMRAAALRPRVCRGGMGAVGTADNSFRAGQVSGHTTVTILWKVFRPKLFKRSICKDQASLDAVYKFLNCSPEELDIGPEAAISVLKKWYAKNPIEPGS